MASTQTAQFNSNPRGIPKAPFIEKVEAFITPDQAEETLTKFNEMISKFKYMENHLNQRKESLESKIPEIKETNDMVSYIIANNKPMDIQFELNDTLWANAKVPETKNVYLWLGANVMLDYPTEEASALLTSKLKSATISLDQVHEDLEYLREQITTMEVNIARIYNFDVKNRRDGKVTSTKKQ